MLESHFENPSAGDGHLTVLVLPADPARAAHAVEHLALLDSRGRVVRFVRRNRTNLLRALAAWSTVKGPQALAQRQLIQRLLARREARGLVRRL